MCWGASTALAYIPTSAQILDQYLKTVGQLKRMEVQEKLVYFDTRIKEGTAEFQETVKYFFPDRFRSDIKAQTTTKSMIVTFEKALVLLDGKIAAEKEVGFDYYKDLLLFRNRLMLSVRLQSIGIDLGQTRLDRFENRVVFVIGERDDHGKETPSLYVDKKTFLPLRLVFTGASTEEGTELFEILFLEWKKFGKTKFPSRIELYKNHTLAREINVEKIICEPEFDEALFDVDTIKGNISQRGGSQNETITGGAHDGDVKKTIDDLDKIIEKDQLAF